MKKIILSLLTICLLLGCSDSFLDTENLTKKDTGNFPKRPEDANQLLTGAYAMLTDTYPLQLLFYASEIMSDNCLGGGGISDTDCKDINNFTSGGKINRFLDAWRHNYRGIFRCNALIAGIDNVEWGTSDAELAEKRRITGEVHFLRAHYYFDMARLFERVPLVLSPDPANLPQAVPEELYAQIASDLKIAIENIPERKYQYDPADSFYAGRATKWAAQALMAKVFLFYTGFYSKETLPQTDGTSISKPQVIEWLDDCILNSGHDLADDFRTLWPYSYIRDYNYVVKNNIGTWVNDGNKETLFAVKYTTVSHGDWDAINRITNQVSLYYGPRLDTKQPEIGYFEATYPMGRGWGQATVNRKLYEDWSDEDLRKKGSILNVFDPEEDIYTDTKWEPYYVVGADAQTEETGLWNKKYMPINKNRIAPQNYNIELNNAPVTECYWRNLQDLVLIRFADVLLMAAELGGTNAKEYLNRVHHRAGYTDDVEPTLENIMNERRFELAFEGMRYYDLLRWHKTDLINANQTNIKVWNQGEEGTASVTFRPETRGFLPIPEAEIELSGGVLTQNEGWN